MADRTIVDSFTTWAEMAEPRIRRALTASFGPQVGKEAAADALAHAWERWDDVKVKDNPVGYVFGVGRNKARRMNRGRKVAFPPVRLCVRPFLPVSSRPFTSVLVPVN